MFNAWSCALLLLLLLLLLFGSAFYWPVWRQQIIFLLIYLFCRCIFRPLPPGVAATPHHSPEDGLTKTTVDQRSEKWQSKHNYICKYNNLPTTCFGRDWPSSGWDTTSQELYIYCKYRYGETRSRLQTYGACGRIGVGLPFLWSLIYCSFDIHNGKTLLEVVFDDKILMHVWLSKQFDNRTSSVPIISVNRRSLVLSCRRFSVYHMDDLYISFSPELCMHSLSSQHRWPIIMSLS